MAAGWCVLTYAVLLWNNFAFALLNKTLYGKQSRWGLLGTIRAEGPERQQRAD